MKLSQLHSPLSPDSVDPQISSVAQKLRDMHHFENYGDFLPYGVSSCDDALEWHYNLFNGHVKLSKTHF